MDRDMVRARRLVLPAESCLQRRFRAFCVAQGPVAEIAGLGLDVAEPLGRERKPREYRHPLRFIFNRKNTTPGYAGSLCWADEAGKLHAAFMLRHETTVPALKERRGYEALPDDDTLATWAAEDFISKLNRL